MKFIKRLIKVNIFLFFLIILSISSIYLYAKFYPKVEINRNNSYYLYDNTLEVFFQGNGTSEWVELNSINNYLKKATIAIEDKNFYNHHGFNFLRIAKAAFNNLKSKSYREGASTITQQLAKNLFLDFDKTWKRKFEEVWYTIQIEANYDKDDILESYLNCINYGHGMYGIEKASEFYFNKKASELTLGEAAMLVGIPKSPSNYSPLINEDIAKDRQAYVLKTMLNNKVISDDEYNKAINEKLSYYGKKDTLNLNTIMYFEQAVLNELNEINYNIKTKLENGGIKIYTTLDLKAQEALENSINENILNNDEIQVSGIMMNPNSGAVLGLVGGRDYNKSEYNRAIKAKRQVGSIMKPFLYYNALENGFTASTSFLSQETSFKIGNDIYAPKNYNNLYPNKAISMASAIAFSDNIYAIKTHLFLGSDSLVNTAKRVGIKTKLDNIVSLPLGTVELNPLEITNAYGTLASEGIKHEPYFIEKITDISGNILYEHKDSSEVVLNKSTTFILNEMLKGTYDYNMVDYSYPTNISIASLLTHNYGIKSGSTDTDNWIIGFNKNIVSSIWIGYDDNKAMSKDDFKYSKKIWANAVESYLKDKEEISWYQIPENVVGVIVDPITGNLATNESTHKKILYYVKGSEPSYTQSVFDEYEGVVGETSLNPEE